METGKPIRKYQLQIFTDAGYVAPTSFNNVGIFYVSKEGLIATGPFGSNRINVYCRVTQAKLSCEEQIDAFEALLEKAITTTKL